MGDDDALSLISTEVRQWAPSSPRLWHLEGSHSKSAAGLSWKACSSLKMSLAKLSLVDLVEADWGATFPQHVSSSSKIFFSPDF